MKMIQRQILINKETPIIVYTIVLFSDSDVLNDSTYIAAEGLAVITVDGLNECGKVGEEVE
jgi:hypothetical protein